MLSNVCITENFPDGKFPYSVVAIFSEELSREPILKENLSHLFKNFKEYLRTSEQLNNEKYILGKLKFDSQIAQQNEVIEQIEKELVDCKEEMNKGISPYEWIVIKGIDDFLDNGMSVKADYALFLGR